VPRAAEPGDEAFAVELRADAPRVRRAPDDVHGADSSASGVSASRSGTIAVSCGMEVGDEGEDARRAGGGRHVAHGSHADDHVSVSTSPSRARYARSSTGSGVFGFIWKARRQPPVTGFL